MLKVQYFGEIAEKTGKNSEKVALDAQNVTALVANLKEKYNFRDGDFQLAVNHELVNAHGALELSEEDEVALLSAFAGG